MPARGLSVDVNTSRLIHEGGSVRLQPRVADLIAVLLQREGLPVPIEHLAVKIWGAGAEPRTSRKTMGVFTTRARKVLRPLGYDIFFAGRRGDPTLTLAPSA